MTQQFAWGDPEITALGSIALNFAAFEHVTDVLLRGFIQPRRMGTILTAGENIAWKLDKLGKLGVTGEELLASTEVRQEMEDWIGSARKVVVRRNSVLHSTYLMRRGEEVVTRMKSATRGGRWKSQAEPFGLEDLKTVAGLIHEGVDAAVALMQRLKTCPEWDGSLAGEPGELH